MELVVNEVALSLVINGVDDFVGTVLLVAIEIRGLSTVSRVVQEEGVIGLRAADEPLHSANDVGLGGL